MKSILLASGLSLALAPSFGAKADDRDEILDKLQMKVDEAIETTRASAEAWSFETEKILRSLHAKIQTYSSASDDRAAAWRDQHAAFQARYRSLRDFNGGDNSRFEADYERLRPWILDQMNRFEERIQNAKNEDSEEAWEEVKQKANRLESRFSFLENSAALESEDYMNKLGRRYEEVKADLVNYYEERSSSLKNKIDEWSDDTSDERQEIVAELNEMLDESNDRIDELKASSKEDLSDLRQAISENWEAAKERASDIADDTKEAFDDWF